MLDIVHQLNWYQIDSAATRRQYILMLLAAQKAKLLMVDVTPLNMNLFLSVCV